MTIEVASNINNQAIDQWIRENFNSGESKVYSNKHGEMYFIGIYPNGSVLCLTSDDSRQVTFSSAWSFVNEIMVLAVDILEAEGLDYLT